MRFNIVSIVLALSWMPGVDDLRANSDKPNILLVIADDMGVDVTNGFQENDRMPNTPVLDDLRSEGIAFVNAWAAPQCTPTRAAIMSGKYGIKTGVMRPPGNLALEHQSLFSKIAEETSDAYATAVFGKWHISHPIDIDHPADHGVHHFEGFYNAMVEDYYSWEKVANGVSTQVDEYITSHLTDAAIDWVGQQQKPWLLWMAHAAPHAPFHVPPLDLHTVENTNDNQGKYLAAIEAMDHEIGRLLQSFDDETLSNTIILFIGDNGTPRSVIQFFDQDHAKATLYEGGIRVPMIVSGQGVNRKAEIESGLVHVADLYATILEIIGIQVPGGIFNSLSLKPSLTCAGSIERAHNYTDYEDQNTLAWCIRNEQYKLIENEDGDVEFYDLTVDLREEVDLIDQLDDEQQAIRVELAEQAMIIRNDWSCADGIQNGTESSIDGCDSICTSNNSTSQSNIGCCAEPSEVSVFYEYVEGEKRGIYTNNYPNHSFCFNPNLVPEPVFHNFRVDLNPQVVEEQTQVVRSNGRPARYFGVAKNGVIMAPAPALPFVFENPTSGEVNWDWVFEPINNQGNGRDLVALDCASAHTGGQGYHYHGNMYEYLETVQQGITTTAMAPEQPIHIGWAADGFPIVYRFGPGEDGKLVELLPSYQLRGGSRPGDGIQAPCGDFNGKYTRDYEYICGKGDLDECNGVQRDIEITTSLGTESFQYFYVITTYFPQIPRCLVGSVSADFDNGSERLSGVDLDGDGFIGQFDCNDDDPNINPNAIEVEGNEIDENCDNLLTTSIRSLAIDIRLKPNPSSGYLSISCKPNQQLEVDILTLHGVRMRQESGHGLVQFINLDQGMYLVYIRYGKKSRLVRKVVVQ